MRLLALHVPCFRLKAHARADPDLGDRPAVLMSALPPKRGEVIEVHPAVRTHGVRVGMSYTEAMAMAPDACAIGPDDDLYAREVAALLEALRTFSPCVEYGDGTGLFFLDASCVQHLHDNERTLAMTVAQAASALGYRGRVGIASVRPVARLAAIFGKGLTIVHEGDEASFVAPLPLQAVPLPAEVHEGLILLGVHTLGELREMPAESVRSRFGPEGLAAHRLARGLDAEPFTPPLSGAPPPSLPRASLILESPLADISPLLFILRGLLDEVALPLLPRGQGIVQLAVDLRLDSDEMIQVSLSLPRPLSTPRVLLDLLGLRLADLTREKGLPAPVSEVTVCVTNVGDLSAAQKELFSERQRNPEKLEAAIARLRDRLGAGGALSPRLLPSTRPEGTFLFEPFQHLDHDRAGRHVQRRAAARLDTPSTVENYPIPYPSSLRLIHPPRAAEVVLSGQEIREFRAGSIHGQVAICHGPDRLSGEWWRSPFARDYFKVTTRDGGVYWLYRELGHDDDAIGWHLHGIFD